MRVVTLVPRRAHPERDPLWKFARRWWTGHHPDYTVFEGDHDDGGPFNRSAAINAAADAAGDWDVAIILDADVIVDPDAVRKCVEIAASGRIAMAGDHRCDLTKRGTDSILKGYVGSWAVRGFLWRTWRPHWSSCIVVGRALWDEVDGFDELFIGWGYEDNAFMLACETMSGQKMVCVPETIWHLYHDPQQEGTPQGRGPNYDREQRYVRTAGDRESMRALTREQADTTYMLTRGTEMIPRMLHRTVPERTTTEVERWWAQFETMHPDWECYTFREPLNSRDFPLTSDLWARCANGAQKSGLIRLELLITCGGVYVDSDVEPVRSFEPLLHLPAFAAWEDERVIPDAVLGSVPKHPAFLDALTKARAVIKAGGDAWHSGPGVTTEVLADRPDVLVLPPGAFYPYHYLQQRTPNVNDGPWVFARHHWHGSWLTAEQRNANQQRQLVP